MQHLYLVGTPNVGKTTLFNRLCNTNEETGNYAGTTLEVKKRTIHDVEIIDVPGMYGGKNPTQEERVAWKAIENGMENAESWFVQVIDPEHWKTSLTLTLELKKRGIPLVLFINIKKNTNNATTQELIKNIQTHLCVGVFAADANDANISEIFFKKIKKAQSQKQSQVCTLNEFELIKSISPRVPPPPLLLWSDSIVLHPVLGIVFFAIMMWIVFQLVFTLGAFPSEWIDAGVASVIEAGKTIFGTSLLSMFFFDGIVAGVGATLVFLPTIILLFLALSLLKESGYLARSSYLFNSYFKKIGLSGRVSVPLLMGFGCNVPAVMAISTLESRKEKISVALMSLFMSCGARLPVYSLLIGAFIPISWQGITLFSIYFFGIAIAFFTGGMVNKLYPEPAMGLRLQFPPYQSPSLVKAIAFAISQGKDFFERVWKFIVPVSIILWAMFTFPLASVEQHGVESSYGAALAKTIQPVFEPMGFDWTMTAGIVAGIAAKEVMVTNFAQIYKQPNNDESLGEYLQTLPQFSLPSVMALLIFTLLYMPCIAVIATIKAQLGTKWAFIGAVYPTIVAWICAMLVYQIGRVMML